MVYAPTAINNNPQIGGLLVSNLIGTVSSGVFSLKASGLTPGTAYSYSAYAKNSVGIVYSPIGSFITPWPFTYASGSNAITINGYTGGGGAVDVPASINGLPVTTIAATAFQNNTTITSVALPASVTSIGTGAFSGCTSLTAITVASTNPKYSSSADGVIFDKGQTTLIQYPAGKEGYYTIPSSVTGIMAFAFSGCASLIGVTIPSSVTSIGNSAFASCGWLAGIYCMGNAPAPGTTVFTGDANATIYFLSGKTGWSTTYGGLTAVLLPYTFTISNGKVTITSYTGRGGAVVIPAMIAGMPVIAIGSGAFQNNGNVTTLTIPASVTSIGSDAFSLCTGLTKVTITKGVASIGNNAFALCRSLTSITIPDSVTSIGDAAFAYCSTLTSATFKGNAPVTMGTKVFTLAANGFKVNYYTSHTGFTVPAWKGYTAATLGISPVANWLTAYGYPANTYLPSTPNQDGVSLLMAYALNLNPSKNQAAKLPKAVVKGGNLSYTNYGGNPDVNYQVQASADLKTWSSAGVIVSDPDSNGNCTATVPLSSGLRFFRMAVTQ